MRLTHADVAEIIKLIDSSTLEEVIIELGDIKVEVRRRGAGGFTQPPAPAPPAPAPNVAAPTPATVPSDSTHPEPPLAPGQLAVRSPMVGTFYRRPSPEEPVFVEPGSLVEAGAPLGLVEVMKLFTTIYADAPGRVAEIRAEDAALVEYDQVLFVLDPT